MTKWLIYEKTVGERLQAALVHERPFSHVTGKPKIFHNIIELTEEDEKLNLTQLITKYPSNYKRV